MKGIVTLIEPEEHLSVEIDAWARLQFERNATKHGLPAGSMRDVSSAHPELFMCIASYYWLKRHKLFDGSYSEYEYRWGGIQAEKEDEDDLTNPTIPAQ